MDIDWIALDMDCIGFEVAYWIGRVIFLLESIGLGCFNSEGLRPGAPTHTAFLLVLKKLN